MSYIKHKLVKGLVLLIFCCSNLLLLAQKIPPVPNPPKLVNDYAGVLSKEQVDILEQKLVALDDSTSNQIAVVLIKSLEDYPIEEYALKLFRTWGIGNKKTNNGVLLIAAIDDKKIRIEVGYGLEGAIPDITAATIIRNEIGPFFREGNFYRGIDRATDALSKAAAGEYKVKRTKKGEGEVTGKDILIFIVILFVVLMIVGNSGRGGGGTLSKRGYQQWNTPGGFFFPMGGGGFGGGRGGGFGGGGFGGFGGGFSGGGGASGSW